jgi:hypothetical protein
MSFATLFSCSDGSSVRVNPDFVVAVEPEGRLERSVPLRFRACRISLVDGEQFDVPCAPDEVQRTLGLNCIRLVLFPSGTLIFLNPSLVLAVEDLSGGEPLVTRSQVMIVMGGVNSNAGHDLAPAFMVRETAQQIMEAILAAKKAHAPGLVRVSDSREASNAAPCGRIFGPSIESPKTGAAGSRRFIPSPSIRVRDKQMSV